MIIIFLTISERVVFSMNKSTCKIPAYLLMLLLLPSMDAFSRDNLFTFGGGISKLMSESQWDMNLGYNGEVVGMMKWTNHFYVGGKISFINFLKNYPEPEGIYLAYYDLASISIFEFAPVIRFFPFPHKESTSYYFQVGFGYFNYIDAVRIANVFHTVKREADHDKNAGIDVGLGILFRLSNGINFELGPSYRVIFLKNTLRLLTLNLSYVINKK